MKVLTRRFSRARKLAALVAMGVFLTPTLAGALEDECPKWFPDFRCDRQGRYEGFVPPVTMPYLFEDPFITTGVQLVGIWHQSPGQSAFGGGDTGVLALQARIAITDRFAFIATRDGYMWNRPDTNLATPGGSLKVLDDQDGWMDIAAGFKYAVFDMPEHQFIFTPALRFQIPVGQRKVFQGNGSGLIIPSFSTAKGFGKFHTILNFGANIPFDTQKNNTNLFYNLHFDYAVLSWLVPFLEMNGMSYVGAGDGSTTIKTALAGALGPAFSHPSVRTAQSALFVPGAQVNDLYWDGFDVANLGSDGIGGRNSLTMATGFRFPITPKVSIGVAYEFPIAGKKWLFKQRVTSSLSWEL